MLKKQFRTFLSLLFPLLFIGSIACSQSPETNKYNSKLLSKSAYNDVVSYLDKNKTSVAINVIYNDKIETQYFEHEQKKSWWYYLKNQIKKYGFKYKNIPAIGIWMGPLFLKNDPSNLIRGTSNNWNYGMHGYPLLYYNHKFAQLGINNYYPHPGEILEITYNHDS